MIVEKRKRIRKTPPAKLNQFAEFNICVPDDWENEPVKEPSRIILMAFVFLTGLSAYAIGSYFFGGC